jgi:hypothetical protein
MRRRRPVREYWPAIQKVAAALLESGILTGDQVKEIIASTDARVVVRSWHRHISDMLDKS